MNLNSFRVSGQCFNPVEEVICGNRQTQAETCATTAHWEFALPAHIMQNIQNSEALGRLFRTISELDCDVKKQVCSRLIGIVEELDYDARKLVLTAADEEGISLPVCVLQSGQNSEALGRLFWMISECDCDAKGQIFSEFLQECIFEHVQDDGSWRFIAENFAEFFPEEIKEALWDSLCYLKPRNYGSIPGDSAPFLDSLQ
jgi:hypothetical protein